MIKEILKEVCYVFTKKQKVKLGFLFVVIGFGTILEMIGITAVLPFINVIVNPDSVLENKYMRPVYDFLNMNSTTQFLVLLAMLIVAIYVIKNVYLVFMNKLILRFTYNGQRKLSYDLMKIYMKQPYLFFLEHNSAELIRNVASDTSAFYGTVTQLIKFAIEILVSGVMVIVLFATDIFITITVASVLILFFVVYLKIYRKRIQKQGAIIRNLGADKNKWLMQSFGGIKEVKILERDTFFVRKYDEVSKNFSDLQKSYQNLIYLPKPFLEVVCIGALMSAISVKLMMGTDPKIFVSTLAVFAFAAFRLLPACNNILNYANSVTFNKPSIDAIYNDFKSKDVLEKNAINLVETNRTLEFNKEINIKNLYFRYPNVEEYVLKNASLVIPKNLSVAFIGSSGAGKTTMADLLLGVLDPESGMILLDETDIHEDIRAWHKKLGYIPQTIFLSDDTIKNNVALGVDEKEIDEQRLWQAIEDAQLMKYVKSLEKGIYTEVGERGVRLSGGQRQRIGIARALYNNPEVLVLDEATSALDNDTETAVMEAIENLAGKKTLIIIAHRLSTIKNCDIIYKVENCKIEPTKL